MFNSKILKVNDYYVIENLPHELIMCIMEKLSHQSPNTWANAIASCPLFRELGNTPSVLQLFSVDMQHDVHTSMLDELVATKNTEAIFRKSLLKFFTKEDEAEAFQLMIIVLNLNHNETTYCLNFMKLFIAMAEQREEGIQELSMLEDNSKSTYYVTSCRWQLKNRLLKMKYKFPNYLDVPLFCNSRDEDFLSHLKRQLPHNQCPRCVSDIEVVYMSAISTCKHIATI
ncbi:hypothetical protein OROMI_003819 [Orobanche minor]